MRLQKYLASAGVGSRRYCEELIAAGRVKVNGMQAKVGQSVTPGEDRVEFRGREVKPEPEKVVIALNKPAGYLSACFRGMEEGWLVTELVDLPYRLFPVGRLDRDSEGLLLLTNDGELANRLTHPRYEQEKEYEAEVDKPVRFDACERLLRGVELEDGPARAKSAKLVGEHKLRLVLTEGRKREVRRMIESLGLRVVHLRRTRIAGLRLGDLATGKWRRLSEAEVRSTLQ